MRGNPSSFEASASSGPVSALSLRPDDAWAGLVFAHGAGAGMHHPFMAALADCLAARGIATFRYQFPYMEAGSKRPDRAPVLMKTVRNAVAAAAALWGGLPLLAGGKSMGGRMTSNACAAERLPRVRGLVFFGFPLHPAGRPSTDRADHLSAVRVPMLFLQGTRDALAGLELLIPACAALGETARLHVIEGADHGFHVLKRSGRTDTAVLDELADVTRDWAEGLVG
ncbi:MAG: alpha/beta hydrolase [Gemmatimonadota bacterium]